MLGLAFLVLESREVQVSIIISQNLSSRGDISIFGKHKHRFHDNWQGRPSNDLLIVLGLEEVYEVGRGSRTSIATAITIAL
jgi:hypothetical protein